LKNEQLIFFYGNVLLTMARKSYKLIPMCDG